MLFFHYHARTMPFFSNARIFTGPKALFLSYPEFFSHIGFHCFLYLSSETVFAVEVAFSVRVDYTERVSKTLGSSSILSSNKDAGFVA